MTVSANTLGTPASELERLAPGLSAASIAELGKDGNVTRNVLARVCEALDCSLEQIALAPKWSDPSGSEHERA